MPSIELSSPRAHLTSVYNYNSNSNEPPINRALHICHWLQLTLAECRLGLALRFSNWPINVFYSAGVRSGPGLQLLFWSTIRMS